jgi:hypothetical protein
MTFRTSRERWLIAALHRRQARKANRKRIAEFLNALRYGIEDWFLDGRPL